MGKLQLVILRCIYGMIVMALKVSRKEQTMLCWILMEMGKPIYSVKRLIKMTFL